MKATKLGFVALLLTLACNPNTVQHTAQWSETAEVRNREGIVVSYRAKLDGNLLVIEASHAPGWHTYALDNVERAQKKSGEAKPETELPTRIELKGELKVVGNWLQSKPKDLSQTKIRWYTWGFSDVSRFAVKVERVGTQATILIHGQACNATSCRMIDGLAISLPLGSKEEFAAKAARTSVDLSQLVEAVSSQEESKTLEKKGLQTERR